MSGLFRSEVYATRRQRLLGSVSVENSAHIAYGASLILIGGIAFIIWVLFATYARTEIVPGTIITTEPLSPIYPPRPGIVDKLYAQEGKQVRKGDILAIVGIDARTIDGEDVAQLSLAALAKQEDTMTAQIIAHSESVTKDISGIDDNIADNDRELQSLRQQLKLQDEILASFERLVEVIVPLVGKGSVSQLELERRRQAHLQERQRHLQISQQIIKLESENRQLHTRKLKTSFDGDARAQEIRSSIEALAQQRSKLKAELSYSIIAPISGIVTSLRISPGRNVEIGRQVMSIIPANSAYEAELFVNTRARGFISEGQSVRLMYDAFPSKRFGSFPGTVTSVSKSALPPDELRAPLKLEEVVYPIRVRIDKSERGTVALQPGMTLTASIVLDRRTFGGLLLEPIRTVMSRQ